MSDLKTIHELLADVQASVTHVGKGDRNDFHKFMFRGVDRVINEVGPALRAHRVLCLPTINKLESRDVLTEKGKTSREVTVDVTYTFYGPAGDRLDCTVPGEAQDTGDKAVSKAMSVAYRTAMIQSLNIPTEQADPDAQVYSRGLDLLTSWKNKVWQDAEKREWDVDQLAYAYNEWTQGGDIREADVDKLKAFHEHLEPTPTKVVRRRPLEAAPQPEAG